MKPSIKPKPDKMVELVEGMLDLNKKLPEVKTAHEKTMIEWQIAATDKRIKKWNRARKIEMIEKGNPNWRDLYPSLTE
ncbi:hypothetical protein ACFL1X_11505 [Candidatus Hydrogenedentota bacterium]